MKTNFKSPRYVIPVILLPFLFLFFYAYKQSFGKEQQPAAGRDSLQYAINELPSHGRSASLKDKLDAYRAEYKKADGYTAINSLQQDSNQTSSVPSLYNDREKRLLDSLQKAVSHKYADQGRLKSPKLPGANSSNQQLAEALNRMQRPASTGKVNRSMPDDPMLLFRRQMALIDSMEKARDPEFKAAEAKRKQTEQLAKTDPPAAVLPVSKADDPATGFNTIRPDQHDHLITAMVDQNLTGYAGSRLRIRLLEDLMAGHRLIRQGTNLYAQITGFAGQRVGLTVTSILQGDEILPVRLDIYDNDGLPGLYVPASAFREFSKDLSSNATQGINLQQSAEQNNQMVMSLVQRMFQSTSTAVSKLIRSNKAKIKYNTLVYLVDPGAQRSHQLTN